jgi:tetratricopeptide (TPR) repeat protein
MRWEVKAIGAMADGLDGMSARAAWQVGALALLFASTPATAQRAQGNAIALPGVELSYPDGLDETQLQPVAEVISVAKAAFDELLPELAQQLIHVEVSDLTEEYYEGVITDRIGTLYIGFGKTGIGETFRGGEGPVGILCQAVAELHNPGRLPGFDRYVAHRHLAPAVAASLGATPLPRTGLRPGTEDVTGRLAMMTDPAYAAVHSDFAAVAAMMDIEQELGFEALRGLLQAVPAEADDPFHEFRAAVTAREPALADAFDLYDQATSFDIENDGTCLVASFEVDEGVRVTTSFLQAATVGDMPVVASNLFEPSFSDEWATDGDVSLRLHADQIRPYLGFILSDPDWRYKDWTRFSRFEMDLRYEGPAPTDVYAHTMDDVGRRHASLDLTGGDMEPGQVRHVAVDLTDEFFARARSQPETYYDGAFRAREVAGFQITVPDPPGPFTLYIDSIRLTPREGLPPPDHDEVATPNAMERDPEQQAQNEARANDLLNEAVVLKRRGQHLAAEKLLHEAIELNPRNVEAHRVLAWTLAEQRKTDAAAAAFRKVIELTDDPDVKREAEAALRRLE